MSYGGFVDADNRPVAIGVSDDQCIALLIKYIGSEQSGTVTIASADITFKAGDVGSEANDTSIGGELDSGATLDVSDAANDTLGECVDLINADANWMAVIVDGLRSDSSAKLLDQAATQCKVPTGAKFYFDTSGEFKTSVLVAPEKFRTDIRTYMYSADGPFTSVYKVFQGMRAEVTYASGKSTYGSGTSTFSLISDDGTTETTFFNEAGGATTALKNFTINANVGLSGLKDQRLIARIANSAAMASSAFYVAGSLKRVLS